MTKSKCPKVSDQIRQAIDASNMTRYRLWKLSGVDQTALSRFMSGQRGLSTEALDAIGDVLEMKVSIPKRPR